MKIIKCTITILCFLFAIVSLGCLASSSFEISKYSFEPSTQGFEFLLTVYAKYGYIYAGAIVLVQMPIKLTTSCRGKLTTDFSGEDFKIHDLF